MLGAGCIYNRNLWQSGMLLPPIVEAANLLQHYSYILPCIFQSWVSQLNLFAHSLHLNFALKSVSYEIQALSCYLLRKNMRKSKQRLKLSALFFVVHQICQVTSLLLLNHSRSLNIRNMSGPSSKASNLYMTLTACYMLQRLYTSLFLL